MNELQARQQGLSFIGRYERFKDRVADDLAALRKQGYKAYIVTVPDSPLSRGYCKGDKGYSIYAEERYFHDKEKKDLQDRLAHMPARKDAAFKEYEKELAELVAEETRMEKRLVELEQLTE